ncbi:MAG: hypothetical protein OEZ68_05595 [Gammaproteobacteria bacterium]|nr:hypothetical protein [Gammaproteobacteria bacterium]MDH5800262.1 hypothetical protein [Gammaproteobacteria bacterium]
MKSYIHYRDRFEALSLRERILILLSLLAILYMMWNMVLLKPLGARHITLNQQVNTVSSQIRDIDTKIRFMSHSISGLDRQKENYIQSLEKQIADIRNKKQQLAVGFVKPKQMVEMLQVMMSKEKSLKVTRFRTLAPRLLAQSYKEEVQPVVPKKRKKPTRSGKAAAKKSEKKIPKVYKHGLEVEFQGDFKNTLAYLQKLEALPWRFYWDELDYEVTSFPNAMVTIRIYTLSLDEVWVSV